MVDLEIGGIYNFTVETPWFDRVIFKLAVITATLSYRAVPDKESLSRELERIRPSLSDSLKDTRWANEEFYQVDIKTTNGHKVLIIPRALINESGLTEVNSVEKTIVITATSTIALNSTLRLLTDKGIKFKEVN